MNISIFIRSYAKDKEWLRLCLQALQKRLQSQEILPLEIVVAIPKGDAGVFADFPFDEFGAEVTYVSQRHPNPYVDQQVTKILADTYCLGDFILHVDSDSIAREPLDLSYYFVEGRPKLLFRKWEDAGTAICWKLITTQVLRVVPFFETMPSIGIMYHRSTHALFRQYLEQVHGLSFGAWVGTVGNLSEFNAIGNFAHMFTPEAYHFIRAVGPGADCYPRPFRQFYSHDGVEKHQVELNQLLA